MVNFEWDPGKAEAESPKAPGFIPRSVFGDPLAVTYFDPDHSLSEQRFVTVGLSSAGKVLIVSHADRDESIRIISVRKVTQHEREHYEEKN